MAEFLALRDTRVAEKFRLMTFPAYRRLLDFATSEPASLAIAAVEDDIPAGLAVVSLGPSANEAKLLSLFVAEPWRGRGLGTALALRVESECRAYGVEKLQATYMSGQPSTAVVERIFARTGWSTPTARMLVVRCSLDSIKSASWLHRIQIPPGHEIVPWVDVTRAERDELEASHKSTRWIADDLHPFNHEAGIEPVTSLALRVQGKIRGWCLNHLVDGLLRYTCSYGPSDVRTRGRILLLWSESVKRMPSIGVSSGIWTVPLWHEAMSNFARNHMRPYATFFGETFGVERIVDDRSAIRCHA